MEAYINGGFSIAMFERKYLVFNAYQPLNTPTRIQLQRDSKRSTDQELRIVADVDHLQGGFPQL
jgi:hypothetical protein